MVWPLIGERLRSRACVGEVGHLIACSLDCLHSMWRRCWDPPAMIDAPYTNEELRELSGSASPERGVYCPKCRNYIPAFADVDAKTLESIRGFGVRSMSEIRRLTGCNLVFAKIWAVHPDGSHPARNGPPCHYCGRHLFSEGTRQCIRCGWDWHDPKNPVQHVVDLRADKWPDEE